MEIIKKIQEMQQEMTRWRQKLHSEPELAFEERATARYLSRQLDSFGIKSYSLARTGVIGVLHGKNGPAAESGGKTIMLRAEMDALPLVEDSGVVHVSRNEGAHHACGHDGHMAMLLGAAKHLAQNPDFDGTVYFVFQPAEERKGGAREMLDEGLLRQFPCDEVYGLHSYPSLPLGTMASVAGPMLAASEEFHITFKGTGGHVPQAKDATSLMGAMAEAVSALNAMAEKEIPDGNKAVMQVSSIRTDSATADVLPETVRLKGSLRTYDPELHAQLRKNLEKIVEAAADKYGAAVTISFDNEYPVLSNSPAETGLALDAAKDIVGEDKVLSPAALKFNTGGFTHYLQEKPGNFMALGTGAGKGGPSPHGPKYDFNDAALPIGASYWVRLVEKALSRTPSAGAPPAPKP